MRPAWLTCVATLLFLSCSDKDETSAFTPDEMVPVVKFTIDNTPFESTDLNTIYTQSRPVVDKDREQIEGLVGKTFTSHIGSAAPAPDVEVSLHKYVMLKDLVKTGSNSLANSVTPAMFKQIFSPGSRAYSLDVLDMPGDKEAMIVYRAPDGYYWFSYYNQFTFSKIPSYKELQPNAEFKILRSMPIGTDSIFAEIRFKVRLYATETNYFDVNDGYFKGYFYRRNF